MFKKILVMFSHFSLELISYVAVMGFFVNIKMLRKHYDLLNKKHYYLTFTYIHFSKDCLNVHFTNRSLQLKFVDNRHLIMYVCDLGQCLANRLNYARNFQRCINLLKEIRKHLKVLLLVCIRCG